MNRRMTLVILLVMSLAAAQACGPDFSPDLFVRLAQPDHPREFAQGKLGVLLTTFPRADLTVAYRYLSGGLLSPAEQASYFSSDANSDEAGAQFQRRTREQKDPVRLWNNATRSADSEAQDLEGGDRELTIGPIKGSSFVVYYLNCSSDAFTNALSVLTARTQTWGANSRDLIDWRRGQDAVFANCRGDKTMMPADAPATASTLLRQDRAYQKAAALFYQARFDEAIQAFRAIGQDQRSPWQEMARYLVTRAMIRKAFLSTSAGQSNDEKARFDPELMEQAQEEIQTLLRRSGDGANRAALQKELDFVRLRTEPEARVGELTAALAGPTADLNYGQHLTDLTWYLDVELAGRAVRQDFFDLSSMVPTRLSSQVGSAQHRKSKHFERFESDYVDLAKLRSSGPLVDWLITFQSPAVSARRHAIGEWRKTGDLVWLVAAITKATAQDPEALDIIRAAEQVSVDSRSWETVNYHRVRLLIDLGRSTEAHALLAKSMSHVVAGNRDSSFNLYRGLQMRSAANLDEALTFAPRKILDRTSEEYSSLEVCLDAAQKNPNRKYACRKQKNAEEFSADAAILLNLETPLKLLARAAVSQKLPENLRQSVAIMAWVRAVLTSNDAIAAELFPTLPPKIQQQAGPGTGFRPLMTLIRNPGLRPYLNPGVQRSYSFDFVESFRDNWWCTNWGMEYWGKDTTQSGYDNQLQADASVTVSFLTPAQRAEGERQSSQLSSDDAQIVLAQRVLTYVTEHPKDADAPESLYLVLRMLRYSCEYLAIDDWHMQDQRDRQINEVRREAARLLRKHYPANPWTKRAAPFVELKAD